MSIRELAYGVIDNLPEEKIKAFLTLFADENTLTRAECDYIVNNPDKRKTYDSVDELIEEILKDDE